jgi:16S rRNA (guanine966-N2)-methyltransferase
MAANEVRIIGGNWKGRKLRFPDAQGLRPTLGRVRETLFNWLNTRIVGSRCLDLFAGSGALGFEALSRGAATVTLVEENRRTAHALRESATRLGAERNCSISCMPADRFLRQAAAAWDIIFLDPPFQDASLQQALKRIRAAHALAPDGVVYFEMPRRAPAEFAGFRVLKEGTAGDTRFGLLAPVADQPAELRPAPHQQASTATDVLADGDVSQATDLA